MAIIREKNIESALKFAIEAIKPTVPINFFNKVFASLSFLGMNDTTIFICVKNNFAKSQLETAFLEKILNLINQRLDSMFLLQFVLEKDKNIFLDKIVDKNTSKTNNLAVNFTKKTGLNKLLTFNSFVVGSFNENVFQIGKSLVKNNKWKFFSVVGEIGQGKTHFLNAFGNFWFESHRNSKIKYVTCEEFTREFYNLFSSSSSSSRIEKLKEEYGSCDLLIFDDFQFINKKEKINEILLSIISNNKNQNQKFVFGMNNYPNSYSKIDKKIVSLLRSGLVYLFNEPTKDDFKKILINILKNYDSTFSFKNDALNYIVNRCQNDLRVLEGIAQRLMFSLMNKLNGEKIITIEVLKNNLSKELFDIDPKLSDVSPETVIEEICIVYNVSKEELTSTSQSKVITHVRHVCMYVLKEKLDLSWIQIGKVLGSRAHSTVIEGYKKIKKIINKDEALKQYIHKIYSRI